jgi:phosphotransferase system enzyme I (PtsP)
MGGRPLEAMVLLALGFRGLSMSAASIGPVKAMVLATHLGEAEAFIGHLLKDVTGGHSLRDKLRLFAEAHGIPV